jgi:hypothetical protein
MATVDVISEAECERGWQYQVRLERPSGDSSDHTVRLDWAEHEHWCGGRCAPSRVVEVLLTLLLDREHEYEIPDRFDAATVRRWWPEVDQVMTGRL